MQMIGIITGGTEKRNGTPTPLTINKMTRRTWLRSDVGEKFV